MTKMTKALRELMKDDEPLPYEEIDYGRSLEAGVSMMVYFLGCNPCNKVQITFLYCQRMSFSTARDMIGAFLDRFNCSVQRHFPMQRSSNGQVWLFGVIEEFDLNDKKRCRAVIRFNGVTEISKIDIQQLQELASAAWLCASKTGTVAVEPLDCVERFARSIVSDVLKPWWMDEFVFSDKFYRSE